VQAGRQAGGRAGGQAGRQAAFHEMCACVMKAQQGTSQPVDRSDVPLQLRATHINFEVHLILMRDK
jgi:hypothetical protein